MIAKIFNISFRRTITSPMDPSLDLCTAMNAGDTIDIPYMLLIGSSNYCTISTCPNISYATNKCAQFTSQLTLIRGGSSLAHTGLSITSQGVWHYIHMDEKGIKGYAHNLAGFTDTDYAGDVNDRKSTTNWIFTFNDSPIPWALKKQGFITRPSVEAKIVAGSITSAEGIWLIKLGKDFQHDFTPVPLFNGNQSFNVFSNNEVNNNKMKHIKTHFHYTQKQINAGMIKLLYIPTPENLADMLTKPLSPHKHVHLLNILGVRHV